MFLNCMFSIRFWRDFSILILLSDIAISTFPLCLCVENTLSKSKLVTLLKWDVKVDTLVQQRFYLTLNCNFRRNPTKWKQTDENHQQSVLGFAAIISDLDTNLYCLSCIPQGFTVVTGENGMLNSDKNRQKSGQILIVPRQKSREQKRCCVSWDREEGENEEAAVSAEKLVDDLRRDVSACNVSLLTIQRMRGS